MEHTIELLESSRQIELDPNSVADELAHLIEEDKVQNVDTKILRKQSLFAEEGNLQQSLYAFWRRENQNKYEPKKSEAALTHIEGRICYWLL